MLQEEIEKIEVAKNAAISTKLHYHVR